MFDTSNAREEERIVNYAEVIRDKYNHEGFAEMIVRVLDCIESDLRDETGEGSCVAYGRIITLLDYMRQEAKPSNSVITQAPAKAPKEPIELIRDTYKISNDTPAEKTCAYCKNMNDEFGCDLLDIWVDTNLKGTCNGFVHLDDEEESEGEDD